MQHDAAPADPSPQQSECPAAPTAARARHALHYLQWAQQADADNSLPDGDIAQVRQAWLWVSTQPDLELLRVYVEHLSPHLERWDLWIEVLEWMKRDLFAARTLGDDTDVLFALLNLGKAYEQIGSPQAAIDRYLEALPLADSGVNHRAQGVILGHLGSAYKALGEYERAKEYFSQALDHAKELQHGASEVVWGSILGHAETRLGGSSEALKVYAEAIERARATGDPHGEVAVWCDVGDAHLIGGDLEQARRAFEQALSVAATHQHVLGKCAALVGLAAVAVRAGDSVAESTYRESMLEVSRAA